MSTERLQKILARAGAGSRRGVEELIRDGRVTVNGEVAVLGQKADLEHDAIKVDGKRIQAGPLDRIYVLLNKPRGYVSTRNDPQGRPTVLELMPPRLRQRLVPVGRLDFETEGLLLLTDDGELAYRITHPRYGCEKTYEVKVKGEPAEPAIEKLRHGVRLEGKLTLPARIARRGRAAGNREATASSWWTVVLNEGRTRQIREMFFRIGHPVARLRRVAIGPLRDPRLVLGAWRELSELEVEALRRKTEVAKRKGKAKTETEPGVEVEPQPKPAPRSKVGWAKPRKTTPRKTTARKTTARKTTARKTTAPKTTTSKNTTPKTTTPKNTGGRRRRG